MTTPFEQDPRDVTELLRQYRVLTATEDWVWNSLGLLDQDDLWLLRPTQPKGKQLLLAAGFHGEEPAGCWGLLRFFQHFVQHPLPGVSLSLLPAVNPTGLRKGERLNLWGEKTNCGFIHSAQLNERLSHEGLLLMQQMSLLRQLGRDGFVSLHEDIDADRFYLYTFEQGEEPGPFTRALYQVESGFFEPMPDGYSDAPNLKNGVSFLTCDGSFEDALFHLGTPYTACTETPALLSLARRVEANAAIAEAFVRFFAA